QSHEHLIEQRNVFPTPRALERVKQRGIVKDIGRVQVKETGQSDAARTDVAQIQGQIARKFTRNRERQILNVRRVVLRIESRRVLILLLNRNRLHGQRTRRYGNLGGEAASVEIAAVGRSLRLRIVHEPGEGEHVVRKIRGVPATDIAHLISAAHIRFALSEPWQSPGESDRGTKV